MIDGTCQVPPEGWFCTREPGHEGPCAARELHNPWKQPLLNVISGDNYLKSQEIVDLIDELDDLYELRTRHAVLLQAYKEVKEELNVLKSEGKTLF